MKRRFIASIICVIMLLGTFALALNELLWPKASGSNVKRDSKLTVDCSGVNDGYVMVKGEKNSKRYKLRIVYGDTTLTYDLNNNGNYETFPLQMGSGNYTVSLYLNTSGKKYSAAGSVKLKVNLNNENAAFLIPSQYVNYDASSAAVAISNEICAGCTTDREKYEAVRSYINHNLMYDFIKALTVTSGTLPDIDGCVTTKMGICQDLAAVAACMLRVQGIPTKVAVGYIDKQYHAWNVVLIDGDEILYDPTAELGGVSKGKYSIEKYY